jgi:hypothetical protein
MTYRELLKQLNKLNAEQLDEDVVIYDSNNEFIFEGDTFWGVVGQDQEDEVRPSDELCLADGTPYILLF